MSIRVATPEDAAEVQAIYAPVVQDTTISFEYEPPSIDEMRERIRKTLPLLPWLVSLDPEGRINGYAYAGKHRERAAYQWAVDTSVYVRADSRGQHVGRRLYEALFKTVADLGYFQAFAGIALPNSASVALHERVGFHPIGVYRKVGFKKGAWWDVGWWQRELRAQGSPTDVIAFNGGAAQTARS